MYSTAEAETCPLCALPLTPYHKLPAAEGFDPTDLEGVIADEDRRVPFLALGRGRGLLALASLFGLGLFFLPWIGITFPFVERLSGLDLSRQLGWTWAVPAAWFVLLPTAWSRRTPRRMQSARVAVGMLSMFPGLAVVTLLLRTPRGAYGLKLQYGFLWPMYGTLGLSLAAVLIAAFFGFTREQRELAPTPEAPGRARARAPRKRATRH